MENKVKATFKSNDTEEWLDTVWTRPIGYLLARAYNVFNIHPNVVTITSMIIGAASAFFFAHGSYYYEGQSGLLLNVVAVLMLAVANFLDSADGQLARMAHKQTELGRILDGAASNIWFVPIYCALAYRFYIHHDGIFATLHIDDTTSNVIIATVIAIIALLISGIKCHAGQCRLSDYYRQIHLFFLKGEAGSELDNSVQQQALYDNTPWKGNLIWKSFLSTYVNYTRKQEEITPAFQALMRKLRDTYGDTANIPKAFCNEFRDRSLPLMKYTNILTFNTRAIALYTTCLIDMPWMYIAFEMICLTSLCAYMHHRHEALCREMLNRI